MRRRKWRSGIVRKYVAVEGVSLLFALFCGMTYQGEDGSLHFAVCFLAFSICGIIGILCVPFLKRIWITEKLIIWNKRIDETAGRVLTNRKFFLLVWIILTVCWVPAYLAWFPGIFGYDVPIQMLHLFGENMLTSHHPLFHTWLLGIFVKLGELIQNNNGAYALFTALQMLAVTGSLACSFTFLKKRRVPFPILLFMILWVIQNPILQTLTFNGTKDILFGVCMLLFSISFWELVEPLETLKKGAYINVFLSGICMCLFRNQGIYMVIALTALCLFSRTRPRKFYGCMTGIVICYILFNLVCVDIIKIPKGDAREMLSVPMQQMAAVGYYRITGKGGKISEEQLQILENIIPEEYILAWEPVSADAVKKGFNTEEFKLHFFRYLKNYIQIGLQNPGIYWGAVKNMIRPYWDMMYNGFRPLMYMNTFPQWNTWGIEQKSLLESYKERLMYKVGMDKISVWNQPAVSIWCMTALAGVAYGRKKRTVLLGSLTPILYFGTILLGPVALLRYTYPLILAEPLLAGMLFRSLCGATEGRGGTI